MICTVAVNPRKSLRVMKQRDLNKAALEFTLRRS